MEVRNANFNRNKVEFKSPDYSQSSFIGKTFSKAYRLFWYGGDHRKVFLDGKPTGLQVEDLKKYAADALTFAQQDPQKADSIQQFIAKAFPEDKFTSVGKRARCCNCVVAFKDWEIVKAVVGLNGSEQEGLKEILRETGPEGEVFKFAIESIKSDKKLFMLFLRLRKDCPAYSREIFKLPAFLNILSQLKEYYGLERADPYENKINLYDVFKELANELPDALTQILSIQDWVEILKKFQNRQFLNYFKELVKKYPSVLTPFLESQRMKDILIALKKLEIFKLIEKLAKQYPQYLRVVFQNPYADYLLDALASSNGLVWNEFEVLADASSKYTLRVLRDIDAFSIMEKLAKPGGVKRLYEILLWSESNHFLKRILTSSGNEEEKTSLNAFTREGAWELFKRLDGEIGYRGYLNAICEHKNSWHLISQPHLFDKILTIASSAEEFERILTFPNYSPILNRLSRFSEETLNDIFPDKIKILFQCKNPHYFLDSEVFEAIAKLPLEVFKKFVALKIPMSLYPIFIQNQNLIYDDDAIKFLKAFISKDDEAKAILSSAIREGTFFQNSHWQKTLDSRLNTAIFGDQFDEGPLKGSS